MVRSSKSTSVQTQVTKPSPFINYDLNSDDKAALKKMNATAETVMTEVISLVKEGYKVTIGWDDYADCVAVWLIGHSKECVNQGFILPSRANSVIKAIAACVYKHRAVFDGVWHNKTVIDSKTDDF